MKASYLFGRSEGCATNTRLSSAKQSDVRIRLMPMKVSQGRTSSMPQGSRRQIPVVLSRGRRSPRTRGEPCRCPGNLPGSRCSKWNNGQPVVRGQYGARVLKLYDGVRHEGQDWGIDHGPEIIRLPRGDAGCERGGRSSVRSRCNAGRTHCRAS